MQYLYDPGAGAETLHIRGENHKYLFKVRRFHEDAVVFVRNLKDNILYRYQIREIHKKEASLRLLDREETGKNDTPFHLIWCMIDPKTIEKTLPMLNQLGVGKISFVYCERSQKNFKIDFSRMEKILINSSQQCGRVNIPETELLENMDTVLEKYRDFAVLDFGGEKEWGDVQSVLIGCEGGFSESERLKLQNRDKIGLKTDLILKSETAAVAIASKLLI